MGSYIGVQKIAAKKIGIHVDEYLIRIITEKWCSKCKQWRPRKYFNIDKSRGDGLTTKCQFCVRVNRPHKSHRGRVGTFKGKHHSKETRDLLSQQRMGNISPMKGKHHSLETRAKISAILRLRGAKGHRCHSYKDGRLSDRRGDRFSRRYKQWRFDVFVRGGFACQKCGDSKGGNLNAHHIKPFADFPELRFEVSNGTTLCEICHKKEHATKVLDSTEIP